MAIGKKVIYIALAAHGAALLIFLALLHEPMATTATVHIGDLEISAEVVQSAVSRARGLSGRESLPQGTGMLFAFEEEGSWGIWMKDMRFSIDILWIDTNGKIITIAQSVAPETYPQSFFPKTPTAAYVLEVEAGFAEAHGIEEGDAASINGI